MKITPTQTFIDEMKRNGRAMYGKVTISSFPAYNISSATASPVANSSMQAELTDKNYVLNRRLATCEKGKFKLDGLTALYKNDPTLKYGCVSGNVSGSDGSFATPFVIDITTTNYYLTEGVTIVFDYLSQIYPTDFDIEITKDGTVIDTIQVRGHSGDRYLMTNVYLTLLAKVRVKVLKMNKPFTRACITEVTPNLIISYAWDAVDKLISMSSMSEIDLVQQAMPVGSFELVLDNTDEEFSALDYPLGINVGGTHGIGYHFRPKTKAEVFIGAKVAGAFEYVLVGTYYLESWKLIGSSTVKLLFTDAKGLLDKVKFSLPVKTAGLG